MNSLQAALRSSAAKRSRAAQLARRSAQKPRPVAGEIHSGHVLHVFEQIDFISRRILKYFCELTYEGDSLWWYDPMPHPDVSDLQSTHPHHKHIPPDVKHHRIPAPGLSFAEPNFPRLLEEAESLISNGRIQEHPP